MVAIDDEHGTSQATATTVSRSTYITVDDRQRTNSTQVGPHLHRREPAKFQHLQAVTIATSQRLRLYDVGPVPVRCHRTYDRTTSKEVDDAHALQHISRQLRCKVHRTIQMPYSRTTSRHGSRHQHQQNSTSGSLSVRFDFLTSPRLYRDDLQVDELRLPLLQQLLGLRAMPARHQEEVARWHLS